MGITKIFCAFNSYVDFIFGHVIEVFWQIIVEALCCIGSKVSLGFCILKVPSLPFLNLLSVL